MRWLACVCKCLCLCLSLHAQEIQFLTVQPAVIEDRFSRLKPKNADRADALRQMFAEAGCGPDHFTEQKVKGSKLPNLICVLPGTSERRVVITAHYDKVDLGEGAVDNWTGSALLPSLYQSLRAQPRTFSFVFLLTTDEEKGLIGARGYVKSLTKEERRLIAANVNIDCVGLPGEYSVWFSRADRALSNAAAVVANSLRVPLKGLNIGNTADSDSHAFMNEKIPVIDFHALTSRTITLLHSKKDVASEVDMPTYYNTYKLLTAYLAYLDVREAAANSVPSSPAIP